MSAPDTNVSKSSRTHRGSLWGIAAAMLALLFAVAALMIGGDGPVEDQAASRPIDVEASR